MTSIKFKKFIILIREKPPDWLAVIVYNKDKIPRPLFRGDLDKLIHLLRILRNIEN